LNIFSFVESGGLFILAALLMVLMIVKARRTGGEWPKSMVLTNVLIISIIGVAALGLVLGLGSFS